MRVKATATVHGSPDSLIALADRIVSELILKENGEHGSERCFPSRRRRHPRCEHISRGERHTGARISTARCGRTVRR